MGGYIAKRQEQLLPSLLITALAWWGHAQLGLMSGAAIYWASLLVAGVGIVSGMNALSSLCFVLGGWLDLLAAMTPTGLKGTARFITSWSELKYACFRYGWGPYWGTFKGKPVFSDYEASAFTLGPSGTGKSTKVVQPMAMALQGLSKCIIDFKGELTPVLAPALCQRGEAVRKVNLGDQFTEQVGESDEYNPLCLVADLLMREGGLFEITELLQELCQQLYPEPKSGKGDDKYWIEGYRRIINAVIQICVLIDGHEATLGDVLQLLNNRPQLLRHLQWVCGRLRDENGAPVPPMPIEDCPWASRHSPESLRNYIQYVRCLCAGLADMMESAESKTFDSLITGAQEAVSAFNITSLAHLKTRRSTFRFSELKEGNRPTTVFLMLDPNKANAQAPVLGLILWAMLYEIKQHPAKHRPVYLIADEATNIPWSGLGSLMTWARGYGLRLHFIFQNLDAFREAHGENTLQTLLSESEIIQVLPGQRNPNTLKLLESMLAERSLITASHGDNSEQGIGINSANLSEVGRPLMTADEIRRTHKTLLFIRNHSPVLVDLPSIAAIAPWRKQIGINPFHGRPYLKPVQLRLGSRKAPLHLRLLWWLKRSLGL